MGDSAANITRDWLNGLQPALWSLGGAVVVFGAMGYASWRILRRMPDIPEKAAMLRGAKWGGLAITGLAALCVCAVRLGAQLGLMLSSFCVAQALFLAGMWVFIYRFTLESEGVFAGVNWWLRYRQKGWDRCLEERRKKRQKLARSNRVLSYVWLCIIGAWLASAGSGYWHLDRMFVACAADEQLGLALKQELNDRRVVEVSPRRADFEGPLIPLNVYVTPDTSVDAGQRLSERLVQVLAGRRDRNVWRIRVRPKFGNILARKLYVPPGVTLPRGIEQQPAHPRKW